MAPKKAGKVGIIVLVLIVISALGYFFTKQQEKPAEKINLEQTSTPAPVSNIPVQNVASNSSDSCESVNNSTFRSVNKYEVGLGPNGPVMGYWNIVFENDKFEWQHSDFGTSGTYTCKDNILQVSTSSFPISANYDASKNILVWDNIEYKKVK